jgi:uncharacterized cupredoxin-like copper-binding protein
MAVAALAACGKSSGGTSANSSQSAKGPPVIDVTAMGGDPGWSFQTPAGGVTGGAVKVQLTNKSDKDAHDFQLVRVDGTHTADEVKTIIGQDGAPIPMWLHGAGGVATVGPGQSGEATLRLPAGHYFYFCNEDTNGKKHSQHGMFGQLNVTGDSGAAFPTPTAHVNALEYKFETSGLKGGSNLVEFKNTGKELHMVLAAPILPGKTIDDVKAAFSSKDQQGPPPVDFDKAVGAEVVDPGQSVFVRWNLSAGKYALICFMTDHAGGPPHVVKGMIKEVGIA